MESFFSFWVWGVIRRRPETEAGISHHVGAPSGSEKRKNRRHRGDGAIAMTTPTESQLSGETGQPVPEPLEHNVRQLLEIQKRDLGQRSSAQRYAELIARTIGSTWYLGALLAFALLWIAYNLLAAKIHARAFDLYPFPLLDGVLTLAALVTTTVILIAQNRQVRLEQQHTQLALQINLLTEHKVSKVIHLLEELRHDLPMVRDRPDPQAEQLQQKADAKTVVEAIDRVGLLDESAASGPLKHEEHIADVPQGRSPGEGKPRR